MNEEISIKFAPSRVEGRADIEEVVFRPTQLELLKEGSCEVIDFRTIARWSRPAILWKILFRLGWRGTLPEVADRDWFHPAKDRSFAFYTSPMIVVHLIEEPELPYDQSLFVRIRAVMRSGGYETFDLG